MKYLLHVCDVSGRHLVALSLNEQTANRNAVDVIFNILGADQPETLLADGILAASEVTDFIEMQNAMFDCFDGAFLLKEGVSFLANGMIVRAALPMIIYFEPAQNNGFEFKRCRLVVNRTH